MISVVVPVYNVEKSLRQCLDSVLAQTYRDLELILVDDGSTDASGEICEEYAAKDSRVTLVRQANGGVADARNVGLEKVSDEYVFFVDSDDFIHNKTLETLLRALTENDADLVFCDFQKVDDDGDFIEDRAANVPADRDAIFSSDTALKKLAEENAFIWNVVWNKLYKAELLKDVRFPVGIYARTISSPIKFWRKPQNRRSSRKNCISIVGTRRA